MSQIERKFIKNQAVDYTKVDSTIALTSELNAEISARQAAVAAEASARDAAIAVEASARAAADAAEASARIADVTNLQNQIDVEESARIAAVAAEASARAAADDAEASARQAADIVLQGNIDAEASARTAADLTFVKLDGSREMAGNLSFASSYKITNLVDPTNAQEGATKAYVDNKVAGLSWKQAVHTASAGNNKALSGSTPFSVDSHTLNDQERVLLKDQTNPAENGIYVVSISGGSYSLARASDMDSWAEVVGAVVYVQQGTVNTGAKFVSTNTPGGTLGSTAINFTTFAAASALDGSGTAGYNAYWSGSNNLTAEQYVAASRGGLGADASAFSGILHFSAGAATASAIVNADVDAAAAIAYSKLNLASSIALSDMASDSVDENKIKSSSLAAVSALSGGGGSKFAVRVDSATVVIDGSNNLAVQMDANGGINSTGAGIKIATQSGSGLKLASGILSLQLDANSSLYIDGISGDLSIKLGNMLKVDSLNSNALELKLAGVSALEYKSGANPGVAVKVDGSSIDVSAGNALEVVTSGIVDDSTIGTVGNGSYAKLQIKSQGINTAQLADHSVTGVKLNSNVVGVALSYNAVGNVLDVKYDSAHLAVDGSNQLSIAANGVTATEIASSAVTAGKINSDVAGAALGLHASGALEVKVDDSTIEINSDALRIKDDGVTAAKINSNVAGDGLVQDGDGSLKVNVDNATIKISADAIEGLKFKKDVFTLTSTNITNQYINLSRLAVADSIDVVIVGLVQQEGVDYTVSAVGGVTRITFANDLATGGNSALVAGDVVIVKCMYL